MPKPPLLAARRNGWALVTHPAFRDALAGLAADVEALQRSDPSGRWKANDKAKLLARIVKIVFEEVPAQPDHPKFEQGNTLGSDGRGWRRAKFLGRFRLFFRFDKRRKIIVYAWVNDENTLRQAGGRHDPYRVFQSMLEDGDPPSDWNTLLDACRITPAGSPIERVLAASEVLPEPPDTTPSKTRRKRR
jgi:toxin YhaV